MPILPVSGDQMSISPISGDKYLLHLFQVTGRVLKGGDLAGLQDILALPILSSPARSPEFDFHMTINSQRQKANPEMLLLVRVYTVDIFTNEVVVIGSCLVKVFDTAKKKVWLLSW